MVDVPERRQHRDGYEHPHRRHHRQVEHDGNEQEPKGVQAPNGAVAVAAEEDGEEMGVNDDADQQPRPGDVMVVEPEIGVGEPRVRDQDAQAQRERGR